MKTKTLATTIAALSVGIALAQEPRPFGADPPKACDACAAWNAPQQPFRVFGNTWYVGTAALAAVLVGSPDGHVLLDGGLPQSAPQIDVAELPCDVLLAVHPGFSRMFDALKRRGVSPEAAPVIDRGACRAYAEDARERLDRRVAAEASSFPTPKR